MNTIIGGLKKIIYAAESGFAFILKAILIIIGLLILGGYLLFGFTKFENFQLKNQIKILTEKNHNYEIQLALNSINVKENK